MDPIELKMVYKGSTKNKHILTEDGGNYDVEAVQGIYIHKSFFDGESDQSLEGKKYRLVIEEVDD